MKLIYRVIIRLSVALTIILTVWGIFFYVAIIDELNDEMDDSLEHYSELIIIRTLAGKELPSKNSGSNNQYFLTEVSNEYALHNPGIHFKDSLVYVEEKGNYEPARILTTIFNNREGKFYELVVTTPSIEKDDLEAAIRDWAILLYILLFLVITFINAWVFQRNMKPLYILLKWLDRYRIGKKNVALKNDTSITEFRKLNEAAIRNMERSEQIYEQQKQFIGNASHEMQTPLAICQNRLEMLMEDENLSEVQLEELSKTHQTLEYLSKLTRTLLLLSKIDNKQFSQIEKVNMNVLLKKYVSDFKDVFAHLNITLEIEDRGEFIINMNESLAIILLTNLLKNAYVHNHPYGFITIITSPQYIIYKNTGLNAPLDTKLIFTRFYQGGKKEGSMGLGLSIVDSISRVQPVRVYYYYENGEHCFAIRHK